MKESALRKLLIVPMILGLIFAASSGILAGEKPPTKVSIAFWQSTTDMPIEAAARLGFFREEGIEVEYENLYNLSISIRHEQLISGRINFTSDVSSVPALVSRGADEKIVMAVSTQQYYLMANPNFRTIGELVNKYAKTGVKAKLAVSEVGNYSHLALRQAIIDAGFPPRTVDDSFEFLAVGGSSKRIAAITQKTVFGAYAADAALLTAPFNIIAESVGSRPLLKNYEIPPFAEVGLVATENYLRNNPEAAEKVIRAVMRGMKWALENPDKAKEAMIVWYGLEKYAERANKLYAELHGQPPASPLTAEMIAERSYEIAKTGWVSSGVFSPNSLNLLSKMMVPQAPPSLEAFSDFTIVEKINRELSK